MQDHSGNVHEVCGSSDGGLQPGPQFDYDAVDEALSCAENRENTLSVQRYEWLVLNDPVAIGPEC
jgi:hypothetical protein